MKKRVWDNPEARVPLGNAETPPLREEEEKWVEEVTKRHKQNKEGK